MIKDLFVDQCLDMILDEVEVLCVLLFDYFNELWLWLFKVLIVFVVVMIVCFFFVGLIFNILVELFMEVFWNFELFEEDLCLIYIVLLEFFFVKFKIVLFVGLFVLFFFMVWQIYVFVVLGFYKNECGVFWLFLVLVLVLFIIGVLFVFYVMMFLVMVFVFG